MPNCELPEEAIDWLERSIKPLLAHRGVVVLSHHQYFSSFDNEYPNLARQLAAVEGFADRYVLWLWGHEHRFAAYDVFGYENIKAHGGCLGHGGMPVDRGKTPKRVRPLKFYDDRSYDPEHKIITSSPTDFGVNGYAVLRFVGPTLEASYRDITGSEVVSEHWLVKEGSVVSDGSPKFGTKVKLMADGRITVAESAEASQDEKPFVGVGEAN